MSRTANARRHRATWRSLSAWKDKSPASDELSSELADVALYLLQLASISGINLEQAILKKLEANAIREWDS
jgi:NTP pyrophosphatase (non-canonical NTP hydrolase)